MSRAGATTTAMIHVALLAEARLAAGDREAARRWERAAERTALLQPELTIHLGNLTQDGAGDPNGLPWAAECLQDWPTPIRAVPGCADIDRPGVISTPGTLLRYRRLIGADRWAMPIGRWWFVGLNASLFGSGTEHERDQWEWLDGFARAEVVRNVLLCIDRPIATAEARTAGAEAYVPDEAAGELLLGPFGRRLAAVLCAGLPDAEHGDGYRRDRVPVFGRTAEVDQLVIGAPARSLGWIGLADDGVELGIATLDRRPAGDAVEASV